MNAPSLSEIRSAVTRDMQDEKMDQIRELLIGDTLRRLESRVAALEAQIADVNLGITRQLDALETRIEALSGSAPDERRAAFDSLALSVAELSEQIRRIARG